VVGFSEVLRDSGGMLSDEDRRQLVSTIAVQAIELGHLFDNLLTVTRESERSPFVSARINLETETQTVLDTAEPERRAKIRIVASEHDAIAAGDPALVRQILRNLLTNATDFGDRVEIEVAKSGIVARVSVRDNGPGIPPDRVADAFVLYGSRGDVGQPDSMGVGLYVSRRLARRMSGDLVYRRSGGWTVFELTLPALPPTVVVPPEAATLPAATP
jgi:signal transduction histidine kinase